MNLSLGTINQLCDERRCCDDYCEQAAKFDDSGTIFFKLALVNGLVKVKVPTVTTVTLMPRDVLEVRISSIQTKQVLTITLILKISPLCAASMETMRVEYCEPRINV